MIAITLIAPVEPDEVRSGFHAFDQSEKGGGKPGETGLSEVEPQAAMRGFLHFHFVVSRPLLIVAAKSTQ